LDGFGIPPDFFSDIDIRKGFAYACDYEGIINDLFSGYAIQPATPVIEELPFHNPDQEAFSFDVDKAQQHFQQALSGDIWDTGFTFDIVYNQGNVLKQAVAEFLAASFQSLNPSFQVNAKGIPWWAYIAAQFSDQMPMLFAGWAADYPDPHNFAFPYMHSTGYYAALQGYSNPDVDILVEDGISTLDLITREGIYYQLQSIYHEDIPGIPYAQPTHRHHQRDWVWGRYYNPVGRMNFYPMWKGTSQDATGAIITDIEDLVNNGVLRAGAAKSLTKKLVSAIDLMDRGNQHAASQKLNDFIDQVNSLIRSGRLPVEEGQELIALAQEVIEGFTNI
jgi:peptide/nickel transport system substrate-binding protein